MNDNPVGIFDSGIGGISVLSECRKILPHENFIYLADFSHAPYGNKSAEEILSLALNCTEALIKNGAKAVVAACNTATSVAAETLRQTLGVPLIGLEPAIKPLYGQCKEKESVLLCTVATSRQKKFGNLLKEYGDMDLTVMPQENLAEYIEQNIGDGEALKNITEEIFRGKEHIGGIVLGCTHYVFLKPYIKKFFRDSGNGDVKIFDGTFGAAKHLKYVLEQNDLSSGRSSGGTVEFITT